MRLLATIDFDPTYRSVTSTDDEPGQKPKRDKSLIKKHMLSHKKSRSTDKSKQSDKKSDSESEVIKSSPSVTEFQPSSKFSSAIKPTSIIEEIKEFGTSQKVRVDVFSNSVSFNSKYQIGSEFTRLRCKVQ